MAAGPQVRHALPVVEPYECWLRAEAVPGFLRGFAEAAGVVLDVADVLDRLLDTDTGRGRWLVLPAAGPLHVELAGEPGTGSVEVRARPTGPGGDALLARLTGLGAVYSR